MISTKQAPKLFATRSNKKVVRRIQTETDEQFPFRKSELFSNRESEFHKSKSKFLDVYSKLNLKDSTNHRKTNKFNSSKNYLLSKHVKTEADEPTHKIESDSSAVGFNKFEIEGVVGKGTFGTVYVGHNRTNGEKVAIKKVLQDKRYKNRELEILKSLKNNNVLEMRDYFLSYEGEKQFLNVVMDFFPFNLYQVIKKKVLTPQLTKIYLFQILKGLNYLSTISIAHRDIKPQNILVDIVKNKVVICDFGSAKQLAKGEPNLAYICSRCYRAPELIFGATDYTPQIDMWSTGCILVEMINGNPPFLGDSQIDQLIQIIKVLGTPTKEEIIGMNKSYNMKEYQTIPKVKKTEWRQLLKTIDPQAIDLVNKMLEYSPKKRLTASEAIMHPYFDQLRDEECYKEIVMRCKSIPDLFQFSKQELVNFGEHNAIPGWAVRQAHNSSMTKMSKLLKRPHRLV